MPVTKAEPSEACLVGAFAHAGCAPFARMFTRCTRDRTGMAYARAFACASVDLTRERARYVLERADKRARRKNAATSVCGSSDAVTGRQSGRVASVGHESALLSI